MFSLTIVFEDILRKNVNSTLLEKAPRFEKKSLVALTTLKAEGNIGNVFTDLCHIRQFIVLELIYSYTDRDTLCTHTLHCNALRYSYKR